MTTGFLLSNDELVFKVSNYTGTIAAYDKNGENIFFRKLMNHAPNLKGKPIEGREYPSYQIDRSELIFAIADGFVVNNEIHTLVQFYGNNPNQVFDVYSVENGDYLYSYTLDENLRSVATLENGTLIGLHPEKLIFWE